MFGNKDILYKKIIQSLANGDLEYSELAEKAEYKSSGRLSHYLDNLMKAGFISRDYTWDLKEGKQSTISRFRLSDNYLRFYLKYIARKRKQIELGRFDTLALSSFSGWETTMGLQFENLVVNNRDILLKRMNIRSEEILCDNPFWQRATEYKKGCQIDYMVQTKYKNLYVCEIKFSRQEITTNVINEVKEKISRLQLPRNMAVLPVLIHVNGVAEKVISHDYFYEIINFCDLLSK